MTTEFDCMNTRLKEQDAHILAHEQSLAGRLFIFHAKKANL